MNNVLFCAIIVSGDYLLYRPLWRGGSTIRLCICSANLGNQIMGKLDPWIPREGGDCDIVVVNMQESTYTVPNAVYNETVAEAQR